MVDSNVSAALAAKLLRIIPANDSVFLAFPVGGVAFTRQDLDIFVRPEDPAEQINQKAHRKAQFARLMNAVPTDDRLWSPQDRLLWNEYREILAQAEMAVSALTPTEQESLASARDFLTDHVDTETGSVTIYSPEVVAYYRYKEIHEELELTYLDEKLTAEISQDETVKTAWENGRRSQLESALSKAEQDWEHLGHRTRVKQAQATVAALGAKDPQLRRIALLHDCDLYREPDLIANDPVGVCCTFYSPDNIFDPNSTWNNLHLSAAEITALLAEAPAQLRAGTSAEASNIISATIEYTTVTIMRPWFDPSFFDMRSWRLPDGTVVSDGEIPVNGRIPGYVSSMVVARKISVERRVTEKEATNPTTPQLLDGWLSGAVKGLDKTWKLSLSNIATQKIAVPAEKPVRIRVSPAVVTPTMRLQPHLLAAVRGTAVSKAAPVVRPTPHLRMVQTVTAAAPAARITRQRIIPVEGVSVRKQAVVRDHRTPNIRDHRTSIIRGLQNIRVPSLVSLPVGTSIPEPKESTRVRTEEMDLDGVVVLAYKVHRIPRSPNPEPSLPWEN